MEQGDLVLIKRLSRIMEIELEKPVEEMDDEVIAICADWIMEIKGYEGLSDEEVQRRLAVIGLNKAI